jgi:hypothetical protein
VDLGQSPRPVGRSDRDRRLPRKGETFDQAIADFSERYADQNQLDYAALADAAKSGRIEVERDLI